MYVQSNKWAKDPAKLGQFLNNQLLPDELKKYCTHITKNEMPQGLKWYLKLKLFHAFIWRSTKEFHSVLHTSGLSNRAFIIQSTKKQFIMMVMIDLMLWNINRRCSCHRSKVIIGDWLSSKLGKLIKKLSRTFPNVFRNWSCVHMMNVHVRPMIEKSGVGLWKGSSQLRRRKPGMACIWVK